MSGSCSGVAATLAAATAWGVAGCVPAAGPGWLLGQGKGQLDVLPVNTGHMHMQGHGVQL